MHDEQDTTRRAVVKADECFRLGFRGDVIILQAEFCFRDKELALHELHLSNTKCASVTAERDRLRDRIIEMELEVPI